MMAGWLRSIAAVGFLALAPLGVAGGTTHPAVVPTHFQITVGGLEVTALFDGHVEFEQSWFLLPAAHTLQDVLGDLPVLQQDPMPTSVNGYVIRQGETTILVDVGAGHCFGPTLGKLGQHLDKAGIDAAGIDAVLLTHLHPDHVCGLTSRHGEAHFPNATVWVAGDEAAFWLDTDWAELPDTAHGFFEMAREALAPYSADQVKRFVPGSEIMPGVTAVATHGHTPGHVGFLLATTGQDVLVWGDVMHNHEVQMKRPDISINADTDPDAARATRLRLLKQAVEADWLVAAAHFPFPGLGTVRREGDAFRWVPVEQPAH